MKNQSQLLEENSSLVLTPKYYRPTKLQLQTGKGNTSSASSFEEAVGIQVHLLCLQDKSSVIGI